MKILAVAEQRDNKLKKTAFEVVKTARTIADQLSGEVIGLVIGENIQGSAGTLGGFGANRVVVVDHPTLSKYSTTAYAKIVAEIAKKEQVAVVMFSATAQGKDCAPRVAVKLDAGLAADCTALSVSGGEIVATRPVYAGKALTDVRITSAVKIFTLRPNVFNAGVSTGTAASVEKVDVPLA
jgi:electron transfer flavoprotein alpha subunit